MGAFANRPLVSRAMARGPDGLFVSQLTDLAGGLEDQPVVAGDPVTIPKYFVSPS